MRYFYEKPKRYSQVAGKTIECDHPIYNRGTLYLRGDKGLCVIQQRYLPKSKRTYWTEIDPWLVDEIYTRHKFVEYFEKYATEPKDGIYPTVTVRQIMYALGMKPMHREPWESVFDRCPI